MALPEFEASQQEKSGGVRTGRDGIGRDQAEAFARICGETKLRARRPRRLKRNLDLTLKLLIELTRQADGFRLFGFGKKKDEAAETRPVSGSVPSISTYAPGAGLIEEEVIEGEEFEVSAHPRRHKADEHDLDDYEEETLPPSMRTGELGEMLQEAHLDHRIQLNFDEKNGKDETFDEDEEEATAKGSLLR